MKMHSIFKIVGVFQKTKSSLKTELFRKVTMLYKAGTLYKTRTGYIAVAMLALALCFSHFFNPIASYAAADFSDVPYGAWYRSDVMSAVEMGLVNGTSATTFSTEQDISFFEVYKLAACMYQFSTTGKVTLQVGAGAWYKTYLNYALEHGILDTKNGYAYYERIGDSKTARGSFMKIFSKALPAGKLRAINEIEDGVIPDVSTDYVYRDPIYQLYRAGILSGVDEQGSCNAMH